MKILKQSIKLTIVTMIVCGVIYPLSVTLIGNVIARDKAQGSMLYVNGKAVGSKFVAQNLDDDRFFRGRYHGETNTPPSQVDLKERAEKTPWSGNANIPLELLTNSGSDLDPHITVESAKFQVPYISRENGISENELIKIIENNADGNDKVNVLEMNIEIAKELKLL